MQKIVPRDSVFTVAPHHPCPTWAHCCICCCPGLPISQCPVPLALHSHQSHLSAHHNPISMRAKTSPALQNHFSASLSPASVPVSAFICTTIESVTAPRKGRLWKHLKRSTTQTLHFKVGITFPQLVKVEIIATVLTFYLTFRFIFFFWCQHTCMLLKLHNLSLRTKELKLCFFGKNEYYELIVQFLPESCQDKGLFNFSDMQQGQ